MNTHLGMVNHIRWAFAAPLMLMGITAFAGGAPEADPNEFLFGDALPDAPELASRGEYAVGVRTLELTNPDQIDILQYSAENPDPGYDRPLTLELWYPALVPSEQEAIVEYQDHLGLNGGREVIPFSFKGRALRDAEPLVDSGEFPLVVVSHGYPGSRYMLTYLTENLASKGYVVAAIDHTESIFTDVSGFTSTLLNRPLDILFVIDEIEALAAGSGFLSGIVDTNKTALIGYSMGGYGALNAAGAGFGPAGLDLFQQFSQGSTALEIRAAGNEIFEASSDERIQAVIAFAPWGMGLGFWDSEGLSGLTVPTLFIVGSEDDVSGYENGVRALFEGTVNANRYLLTYENARHNVAPNPPSVETLAKDATFEDYERYSEPAWSERRINNINQHFVTAFLGLELKGLDYGEYLDLIPNANDGVTSLDEAGNPTADHTHWKGFKNRTAVGLRFERADSQE